jgi:two-component system OmpR family sensor kinase
VTLRLRLTLWYSLVLVFVLMSFGGVVYFSLTYSLTAQIDDTLSRVANEIIRVYRSPEALPLTLHALNLTSNTYVQVWNDEGQLLWQSTNSPSVEGAFDPDSLLLEENVFTHREVAGMHIRVLTVPVMLQMDGRVVARLQIASPMDAVDLVRGMLIEVLIAAGLIATIVAAVIGYIAASAALRPIDQVTETVLKITRADDLSRRIPLSTPPTSEDGRLIQAINETLERLEDVFDVQRRFLADVSHELRTPLTAIRGNVDLIRHTGEADEESLNAITDEVDRMTRLVGDLLLLAKAESGKISLGNEIVELDTLLLEVYRQAKLLARNQVEISIGQEDQARVMGDRDRLKQVFLNLVSNALDYTPPAGKVTLSLKCVQKWACLSVKDTGSGIPEEELPYIFDRFYRVDRSRRRKASGGVGLGLSIANWIVINHGGHIDVSSQQGKGSEFTIWLPRIGEDCADTDSQKN